MSAFDKKYFTLDGGLSYKKFLKHFKDQAKGTQKLILLQDSGRSVDSKGPFKTPTTHGSLVLVDLADHVEKNDSGQLPKVEVVEPTEADRRRALDQVQIEAHDRKTATAGLTKPTAIPNGGHSKTGSRKGQNRKRKNATASTAKKVIKRSKDFFD